MALRLFYMDNAKEDVRSDIAVMRRAAEKADTEVHKSEVEKQKQVTSHPHAQHTTFRNPNLMCRVA